MELEPFDPVKFAELRKDFWKMVLKDTAVDLAWGVYYVVILVAVMAAPVTIYRLFQGA